MLKIVILFSVLAATATAFPDGRHSEKGEKTEPVAILKSERHHEDDGSFSFSYEGADGSSRQETGNIVNADTDDQAVEVTGSYRYYDADGQLVEVTYTAGKGGFIPIGTNIPSEISAAAKAASDAALQSDASEK